ncbi:DEAD/DEAH box helicase [Crocinitomicaceae bacterium CZZ-1]|uniref:DEAD/DEAH box helicase n=1 Tax=Taishania pollutisoli TaxID=2766479 RepID=A0A8J6PEP6_9FLAO|nr:DEAD/DEAH box helicase [Taishania pollutisoli]MBC9812755.1 DEAD/DEAH box helicase [Taishania pollutisoli]
MKTTTNKPRFSGNRQRNKTPKKSTLDPNLLVQKATVVASERTITVATKFEDMQLQSQLKSNIQKMGFVSPTEIQDKTFDRLVEGANLIGIANTGTGKTGAFLIPILENLLRNKDQKFQSLIVVPTRELALQVYDEFKKLSEGLKLRAACYIGGTNIEKDIRSLNNYFDLVIGTPGRLLDLCNRGNLKLGRFEVLVLDEFDKMLDMGFIRDVRELINGMKQRRQTLLFSATKDPKQQTIINEIVTNPFLVEIHSGDSSSKNVDQDIIRVQEGQDKYRLLLDVLANPGFDKVILFTETKHLANRLSQKLIDSGITSDRIHGNKSQNYRINALDKFKNGSIRVLVATDVAARGIDVNNVALVVNYQLPMDFDTYIHRIGRTGRAGKTGTAYTFVD